MIKKMIQMIFTKKNDRNDQSATEKYEYYKNLVKKEVKKAKQSYFRNLMSVNSNNSEKLWDFYKRIMSNKYVSANSSHLVEIVYNNTTINSIQEISNALNSYFIDVTNMLKLSTNPIDKHYLAFSPKAICVNIFLTPTNLEEVKSTINSLKQGSATGYDNLTLWMR